MTRHQSPAIAIAVALGLLFLVSPAAPSAQTSSDNWPASSASPAETIASVDQMIQTAGGDPPDFINTTRTSQASVRHRALGVECRFFGSPQAIRGSNWNISFRSNERGFNCAETEMGGADRGGYQYILWVRRRYSGNVDLRLSDERRSWQSGASEAIPWLGAVREAPGLPRSLPSRTLRWQEEIDGRPVYARVALAFVGPWEVALDWKAPMDGARGVDEMFSERFRVAVEQLARSVGPGRIPAAVAVVRAPARPTPPRAAVAPVQAARQPADRARTAERATSARGGTQGSDRARTADQRAATTPTRPAVPCQRPTFTLERPDPNAPCPGR